MDEKIHLVLARIKLLAALKNFKRGEEGACDCVCDNYANCNFYLSPQFGLGKLLSSKDVPKIVGRIDCSR